MIKDGKKQTRTFATMTDELLLLLDWLQMEGCTHVAIESTGVYWKPVFNLLEGVLEVVMLSTFNHQLDRRIAGLNLTAAVGHSLDSQRTKLAAAQAPATLEPATQQALKGAINESFVSGFRLVMLIAVGLALLSAASAWLLIEGKQQLPHP